MCNFNSNNSEIIGLGLNLINKAIEASLKEETNPNILGTAINAYQQGKITKSQLMGVINALDEQTYQTKAYSVPNPTWNDEYLEANKFLNQFRG